RAGDEPPPARPAQERHRRGRGVARRGARARLSAAAAAVRAAARLAGRGRDVLVGAARVVQATRRGVGEGEAAMTSTTDAVTVTTCVAVDPTTAFTVFTDEIDRWWRRGPRYRFVDGHGTLAFTEGRLVERGPAGSHEVGRVLQWEP